MSEYMEIDSEFSDDDLQLFMYTNLMLAPEEVENYASREEMAEGTPLAQMLSTVDGIAALQIDGSDLTVTREVESAWHHLVSDISSILKEFFL